MTETAAGAMFTVEVQQALRALVALAGADAPLVLDTLARRAHAPAPALAKTLARLARMGLVVGRRGPGGGYTLGRPAGEIRLADIVGPMQGEAFARTCLFGLPHCSDDSPCPLHPAWGAVRRGLLDLVESETLASLASRSQASLPGGARRGTVRRPLAARRPAANARSKRR